MFSKPPFIPLFFGVLLVPLIIWLIVTPGIADDPPSCRNPEVGVSSRLTADTLNRVPPNKRLKLSARVD